MGVTLLHFVLVLIGAVLILSLIARRLHVAPAVVFVLGGMALAATPHGLPVTVDPELVMALFLPPLLHSAAYFTEWRAFKASLSPILTLAIGAVLFTTVAVAVAAKLVAPELPWAACFALGAIVSPPDAVAASAVLKRMRLPDSLSTILEGESLVNDASGLVLYRFAVAAAMTGSFSLVEASGSFALVAVGGIAIGLICGKALLMLIGRLKDTNLEIAATFGMAYGSYLLAESVHVSGVLATVTCGLVLGAGQHGVLSSRTRLEARAAWAFMTFLLEALVFVLIGLALRDVLQRLAGADIGAVIWASAVVVATTIVSRFVWVYASIYLPSLPTWRRGAPAPSPFGTPLVVSWTGMRGVVSLAAALALPMEFPSRDMILLATFAVILVTVLGQATTLPFIIRISGLSEPATHHDGREIAQARAAVVAAELDYVERRHPDLDGVAGEVASELRRRAGATSRTREGNREEREARLSLRLDALKAGREKLLAMQTAGEIGDETLRQLERELDLEEDRFRGLLDNSFERG